MNRKVRSETFEHTISGLLQKRVDLLTEAEGLRDRLAEIRNDVRAIDRVLTGTLGYEGNLDEQMPRQKRDVIFGRGELSRAVLDELRGAEGPLTSREIAQGIVSLSGDARDRKYVSDLTKRVGKALRVMSENDMVRKGVDARGNVKWSLRALR